MYFYSNYISKRASTLTYTKFYLHSIRYLISFCCLNANKSIRHTILIDIKPNRVFSFC
jgi:hypothetical protein